MRGAPFFSWRKTLITPSFNPRARMGRDGRRRHKGRRSQVSIHAPARGATTSAPVYLSLRRFQSTRPRGARLGLSVCNRGRSGFNPRAREGRDSSLRMSLYLFAGFNSRAREGRDLSEGAVVEVVQHVSIHAPARGATPHVPFRPQRRQGFNPRAREGRDAVN